MKQILQSLKDGTTELAEIPTPKPRSGELLIQSTASLVSAGTERMLLEFGQASLLQKARSQPDKVKAVIEKARADGIGVAIDAVRSKLDQPLELGYCNVGQVIARGSGVSGFDPGMRVVSNGPHAEVVSMPLNLCARVPDEVADEDAAFTVLGAIALQGVRLAAPTLGEAVVVIGLGLIGLVTVQLLRAQGCRVLGVDFAAERLALAERFGAEVVSAEDGERVLHMAEAFSRGRGVDAVIVTASTNSSKPLSQAARMSRKRGRIVLVGVTGLELSREEFYEKELTFQVSCSYGPGRYDPAYEEGGQDYPIGFVRWTAQRNFEAVLDMMAEGRFNLGPLISHRFPIREATSAYSLLTSDEPSLGILLEYDSKHDSDEVGSSIARTVPLPATAAPGTGSEAVRVGFLGAGNFAGRILIPAFKDGGAELGVVVSRGGVSSVHHGRKFGFREASTDESAVLESSEIDAVVIATRHDLHARQVLAGLRGGKHVFCEKPLCLTRGELDDIATEAEGRPDQLLMVGFNRRFAPHVVKMKTLMDAVPEPKSLVMTVNAGAIPADHWTQSREVGGGRIIGEGCHFIDLIRFLVGAPIESHLAMAMGAHPAVEVTEDRSTILLRLADGSTGAIHYLANGHKGFPKERLEVFCGGKVLQLDNFKRLQGWGWPGFRKMRRWRQDKGHGACAEAFLDAVKEGKPSPIPLNEVLEVSRVTIEVADQVRS